MGGGDARPQTPQKRGVANIVPNKKKMFWHGICTHKKIPKKNIFLLDIQG
jgi:hypothetical protein